MMEIALLENLQRENLNALEEASAYKKLLEELSLTQDALAKRLGKSRSHITNMLGLLKLPKSVQDLVLYNKLSMGHARVLSKLEDPAKIEELADKVMLPKNIVKAHKDGVLHFHDKDYFIQPMHNCMLVNIKDMLDNGTVINGKLIESPKSFSVACNVTTQIIAALAGRTIRWSICRY